MKLLIVTQSVDTDNPVLGFFVRWIEEFAKQVESIEIICLELGKHSLPKNVTVHSLGKENTKNTAPSFARCRVARPLYAFRFLSLIWRLRHNYDNVFVHMNPEYIVLGGIGWRLARKKVMLWYVHRAVNNTLRIAHLLANKIVTSTQESYGLPSRKVTYVGHGIDVDRFIANTHHTRPPVRIVSVSRITSIKNIDIFIEVVTLLIHRGIDVTATIIGEPITVSDKAYQESLVALIKKRNIQDKIQFIGNILPAQMPEQYRTFDISINLSPDGGMDKTVLESMTAGLLTFVSNRAFATLFGRYAEDLICKERDANDYANKIESLLNNREKEVAIRRDSILSVKEMNIENIIRKILSVYETS